MLARPHLLNAPSTWLRQLKELYSTCKHTNPLHNQKLPVVTTCSLACCLTQNYLVRIRIVSSISCSLVLTLWHPTLVIIPSSHTKIQGCSSAVTAPNIQITTHYVSLHICLFSLYTPHSHLLTVTCIITSFVESNHTSLTQDSSNDHYRTQSGLCHSSNQVDSRDDIIGLTISLLSLTHVYSTWGPRCWWVVSWLVSGCLIRFCDVNISNKKSNHNHHNKNIKTENEWTSKVCNYVRMHIMVM